MREHFVDFVIVYRKRINTNHETAKRRGGISAGGRSQSYHGRGKRELRSPFVFVVHLIG